LPLVMVKPEMVTVALEPIENILLVLAPLMVRLLAPGPIMVRFLLKLSSVPPRVIVPLTSNSIVSSGGGGLNRIPQGAIPFAAAVIVFINQGVHSDYGDCGRLSCLYRLAAQEQYRDQQDSK